MAVENGKERRERERENGMNILKWKKEERLRDGFWIDKKVEKKNRWHLLRKELDVSGELRIERQRHYLKIKIFSVPVSICSLGDGETT